MWAIFSLVGFVLVVYAFTRPRGQRWRYVAGGVLAFLVAGLTAPAEVSQPPGLPEPPAMNAPQPQEQTQEKVEEPASGADATPVETLSDEIFVASCRSLVRQRLAIPESARFPEPEAEYTPFTLENGVKIWNAYVSAQNIYGTRMRAEFGCNYYPMARGPKVELNYFDADPSLLKGY